MSEVMSLRATSTSSHASTTSPTARRFASRSPPYADRVRLSPFSSHRRPAWSIRAKGRARSHAARSSGPQPSDAAFSTRPPSRKRPPSSRERPQHFGGTSPGARSRWSPVKRSAPARGTPASYSKIGAERSRAALVAALATVAGARHGR